MIGFVFVFILPFLFQYLGNKRARFLVSQFLKSRNISSFEIEHSLFFGTTSLGINESVPTFKSGLFNGRDWVLKVIITEGTRGELWLRIPLYGQSPLGPEEVILPDGSSWNVKSSQIFATGNNGSTGT